MVVGLPYPNIQSPELKEYISYLDATLGVSCHVLLASAGVRAYCLRVQRAF